jgi:uncharacterized protein (TIGR02246 family)
MDENGRAPFDDVAASLTIAWNAGDSTAFSQCFTDEADFVNIFAAHLVGSEAIAKQHQFIFEGVYKGSRNLFTVTKARALSDGIVLAQVQSKLSVPQGPMAGEVRTLATAVLVREPAGWRITSFQNTREQPFPGPPSQPKS